MAFRKKIQLVLDLQPDILVIQECEHPEKIMKLTPDFKPHSWVWAGDNLNKGLAAFTFSDLTLSVFKNHNPSIKNILPVRVKGIDFIGHLFCIWANNPEDGDGQYVTQVWKAVHEYQRIIKKNNTMLIGDFNSNAIWDRPRRIGNHSHVVERLAKKGIASAYHHFFEEDHGRETMPTFFLYKNETKPYHLDYCFLSADLMDQVKKIELPPYKEWKHLSDHLPIIVDLKLPRI